MDAFELAESLEAIALEHERERLRMEACPFCGGRDLMIVHWNEVDCRGCGVDVHFPISSTPEMTRRSWNTRATLMGSTRWR